MITIIPTQRFIIIKAANLHKIFQGQEHGGTYINGTHYLFLSQISTEFVNIVWHYIPGIKK